jgi:hypothetical protein
MQARLCAICLSAEKNGVFVVEHNCVANHEGSSKSMESQAAVELMMELSGKGCPLRRTVGDDDSSFKANIRHSYRAKIDAGIWDKIDWPRDKNKRKLTGKGKLPLHVK